MVDEITNRDTDSQSGNEDCEAALRQLYQFLSNEITDDTRDQIHHHLDSCGHCASAYDFEAELRQVIASRCVDRAPESLRSRVRDALGEDSR
ncbi:MAG: mycothiol system anti-sigma-R factor [Actinomycetia bacterium]|nr:mycothiol system anti-sigma-R factor [Actinomycetes bacterium]